MATTINQASILKILGPQPVEWASPSLYSEFDAQRAERERKESHVNPVPDHPTLPVEYLDNGGTPHAVDHDRKAGYRSSDRMIVDDATAWRSEDARTRRKVRDHLGYLRVLQGATRANAPARQFEPKASMFASIPKLAGATHLYRGQEGAMGAINPRLFGDSTRGFAAYERPGELPIISQLIYDGTLPELTTQEAERRQWRQHSKFENPAFFCKTTGCDLMGRGPPFRA